MGLKWSCTQIFFFFGVLQTWQDLSRIYSKKHLFNFCFILFCINKNKTANIGSRLFRLDTKKKPLQASKRLSPQNYTNKYRTLQHEQEPNVK